MCQIHVWWKLVCARIPPVHFLFPELNARGVNRIIRAVLANLNIAQAASYTAHGIRRGESQEKQERGPHRATVAGDGAWRSLDFSGYVKKPTTLLARWPIFLLKISILTKAGAIWC